MTGRSPNEMSPSEEGTAGPGRPDDRFVPLAISDLAASVLDAGDETLPQQSVTELLSVLQDLAQLEADTFAEQLLRDYASVNPDRETRVIDEAQRRRADDPALLQSFAYLLEKGNFEELSEFDLDQAVSAANSMNLQVRLDPDRVGLMRIWVRGRSMVTRRVKHWRAPLRGTPREFEVYRRVAVLINLRDEPHLRLKLFKEIPAADVEALLPHASVSMSLFDRLKLFLGSAGALGSVAWKLVQGAAALSTLAWSLLAAFGALVFRAVTGYYRNRREREWRRTQHLYFQNLANNGTVVQALLHMITVEEVKEAFLAYVFLAASPSRLTSPEALDAEIEGFLRDRFAIDVNFDCDDAVDTLRRYGLLSSETPLAVKPADAALTILRDLWREQATRNYHVACAARRPDAAVGRTQPVRRPAGRREGKTELSSAT